MGDAKDLFGEDAVTWPELRAWVAAVAPHMLRSERSLIEYVRQWNVAGKVAHAKARGEFDAITTGHL